MKRQHRFVAAALVLVGIVGYLFITGMKDSMIYYYTPDELLARTAADASVHDVGVKVGGRVVPGTVKFDQRTLDLRFDVVDIASGKGRFPVHYQGPLPDTFEEGRDVVVEGPPPRPAPSRRRRCSPSAAPATRPWKRTTRRDADRRGRALGRPPPGPVGDGDRFRGRQGGPGRPGPFRRALRVRGARPLLVSSGAIIAAFLGNEYRYQYVAGYSNLELSVFYKVTGLWAGQTGSLVFWALLLALFASLTVFQNRERNREFMPYVVGTLLAILAFFLVVILFASNPFKMLAFTPADGRGLNPQLQNYWMTIHPPTLYLGFTAFTVPFAFAISALLSGRLDTRWITTTRRWTLLAWFFLTSGIIFGMMWAYVELGWGGWWFWDPVENASLLPWLTGTAYLHSVMIQEKRGMLKLWNVFLILATFLLSIFATFLTRSGLIESVHSFAQNLTIA